jgi:HAD superfamily hydrolase (TIGR01662 family)
VLVVDDRPRAGGDDSDLAARLARFRPRLPGLRVVRAGGGGPARARNLGWRLARTPWVSFLDDDVVPDHDWYDALRADLAAVGAGVVGCQGRVRVPQPDARCPTDWERSTAGLATASWITADLTYRRDALAAVGGFDERFPRAFREDADLALRILATGGELVVGRREVTHPVRPADRWVSVRQQAGNADDALMRRLHGRDWRRQAHAPRGRRRRHAAIVACGLLALTGAASGRRRTALAAGALWAAGTTELAWARISPGPRDRDEVTTMLLTSVLIPFAAVAHTLAGQWRHRSATPWVGPPELVLFDRDGTLVHDVPYNADPALVRPVADARQALDRLRSVGIKVGLVSNQSGVAAGRITPQQLAAVQARVEELLGPFDVVRYCVHGPGEGCGCRKPAPGMVKSACAELGVAVDRCAVVGDIGSDVEAARAAGATAVLVPDHATRQAEIEAADRVAGTVADAVESLLRGTR